MGVNQYSVDGTCLLRFPVLCYHLTTVAAAGSSVSQSVLLEHNMQDWAGRAARVIPRSGFGHQNALPGWPQFWRAARGCRLTCTNGGQFIDYLCG